MEYRKFGYTDLLVSEVGFGSWAIGGEAMIGKTAIGWGQADDLISKQAIHAAIDAGVNFFDTADIYGLGHSETILGEAIGEEKDMIIATKVGNVARNDQFTVDYSREYIFSACEASLKRLKRATIDYYQLHTARVNHLQNGECIEAMQLLQQQGKIRYWGISLNTFDPFPEAEYLLQAKLGNGFQLVLNLLNQKAIPLLKKAKEAGSGIIARMPLQFGLLTGKFDIHSEFPASDHRHNRLTKEVISSASKALGAVWDLCNKYSVTKTRLAISYVLSYAEISTTIPGIRTPGHVEQNASGLVKLDEKDRKMIEELWETDLVPVMNLIQQQG